MKTYEQQAMEVAERFFRALDRNATHQGNSNPLREPPMEIVLRELNLAALLEDKARLDWLDAKRASHIYDHFKFNPSTAASQKTWRDAITNAMKGSDK